MDHKISKAQSEVNKVREHEPSSDHGAALDSDKITVMDATTGEPEMQGGERARRGDRRGSEKSEVSGQYQKASAAESAPGEQLTFWGGVRDCVPTLLGYLSIGFAAGVVGATEGFSVLEIGLMSIFLYAGSAQFIVAAMAGAGSTILSIVVTVFFVNLRHLLLSAAVAPFFQQYSARKNFLLGAQLTDETFGVAINRLSMNASNRDRWMLGMNMTAQLNWVIATLVGAWFGAWIPNPEQFGLQFALPAMFAGLVVQQIVQRGKLRTDLIVAGCAVVYFALAFLWLPSHMAVIAAAVAAACTGMVVERR